ncbi:MAG: sugar kinase [Deltaproteobacteria bacterium]|nr:sugar kinase [Deltaproteobacteria bacterium]RLB26580.1 MAG: sugar kinase [Deltaproteobacteria bacterium]
MKGNPITEDVQVIGLGQACVDCLGRLTAYPEEDGKVELNELHIQCGGPASTALVTLSRLGIPTSFLGSISDDAWGIEIVEGLKEEGVEHSFLKITPGYTSQFAFIAITQGGGNRTIFWHRGSVPHLKASDVDLDPFPRAEILHMDGLMIEACQEAARQARERGLRVVLDAGTMREGSMELASMVDVLIASERFAEPLLGEGAPPKKVLEYLSRLGPKEVVITRGTKGSIGLSGEGLFVQDAFKVEARDTTGAGDVYHGAYIYGLLMGWDMRACMRFASATAALKCREIGARKGIPHLNEVEQFLGRT